MPWVMKILGTATDLWQVPQYLKAWDLEYRGGMGMAELTLDQAKAHRFRTAAEVFETWGRQSKTRPFRPYGDGGPNKPLTAYTVSPEQVEEKK